MIIAPNWYSPPPSEVLAVVVDSAEAASQGDAGRACAILADCDADDRWLAIVAVRTLSGLCAGPQAAQWWTRLREEVLMLATETGADDDHQVTCNLEVISLAEAYERGAMGRAGELLTGSQQSAQDIACIAAQLSGQVIAHWAQEHTGEVFSELRRRHGGAR